MAAEHQQREQDAFFAFLATFELERPVVSVSDLSDGEPLFEVLQVVYVTMSTLACACLTALNK